MIWYARKSSDDGKGMNSGIIFNNGEHYSRNEKHAKKYVESLGLNWENELKTINTINEWFYFTDWEELDEEEFYDYDGNVYRLCQICKSTIKVIQKFDKCSNCG